MNSYELEQALACKQMEVEDLRQKVKLLRGLLTRYRNETPVGNQPHMICHEVDAALAATETTP